MLYITAVLGVLIVASAFWLHGARSRLSDVLKTKYELDDLYISSKNNVFIGIAYSARRVVVGKATLIVGGEAKLNARIYNFDELASVTLDENGASVSSTDRGSQLVGLAVGGLAFGGLGAVVGGLSASKKTSARLLSIDLRLRVDDRSEPIHVVNFLSSSGDGVSANGIIAKNARTLAQRFDAHISNAIREAEMKTRNSRPGQAA